MIVKNYRRLRFIIVLLFIEMIIILMWLSHYEIERYQQQQINKLNEKIEKLLEYSKHLNNNCTVIVYEDNSLICEKTAGPYTIYDYIKLYEFTGELDFFNTAKRLSACLENSNFSYIKDRCDLNLWDGKNYKIAWMFSEYYYYNHLNKSAGDIYKKMLEDLKMNISNNQNISENLILTQFKIRELRALEQQAINKCIINKECNITEEYKKIIQAYLEIESISETNFFYINPQWLQGACSALKGFKMYGDPKNFETNIIIKEIEIRVFHRISRLLSDQRIEGYFNEKFFSKKDDVDSTIYTYKAVLALDACLDAKLAPYSLNAIINQSIKKGLIYLLNQQDEKGGIIERYKVPHKTESLNDEILVLAIKYFGLPYKKINEKIK
ncbi:MAG: hypothetical protein QXD43_03270 [Candidatus Aenigmatarchaeota archaeon]